ncbi:MAG: hypothetical protein QXG36_07565, partial [Nitrososphaeria archaeon]
MAGKPIVFLLLIISLFGIVPPDQIEYDVPFFYINQPVYAPSSGPIGASVLSFRAPTPGEYIIYFDPNAQPINILPYDNPPTGYRGSCENVFDFCIDFRSQPCAENTSYTFQSSVNGIVFFPFCSVQSSIVENIRFGMHPYGSLKRTRLTWVPSVGWLIKTEQATHNDGIIVKLKNLTQGVSLTKSFAFYNVFRNST